MSFLEMRDLDHGWADTELREVLRQSNHHQRGRDEPEVRRSQQACQYNQHQPL